MSSTATLARPARQVPPDQLANDAALAPLPQSPLPLDPLAEAALTPASGSAPAFADLLFTDIDIPSTPPAASSDGTEAPAAVSFQITDISSASWAAAKVLAAQARIAQRAELAQSYKARIDAWLSDANSHDEASASYLSLLLKPFVESELARSHSRSRTLHLPTASASLRKGQDRVEVIDDAAAMAYCEIEQPAAIVVKKELSRAILRRLILSEGTPIPGVEASLGSDSLYLKPRS